MVAKRMKVPARPPPSEPVGLPDRQAGAEHSADDNIGRASMQY
jgi:hypothetical protein